MKTIVLDTNVLLDIFVFNDFRAIALKQNLLAGFIHAPASPKTIAEFADVLSRPLFSMSSEDQDRLVSQWRSLADIIEDQDLISAPWKCQDLDDQVFLDLAYKARPCILLSKDNEVLKFSANAKKDGVMISADYTAVSQIIRGNQ